MFSQSRLRCPSSFIFSDDIRGGKLDALQNLLETYGDKKIVIIAETEDELLLSHQYLDKKKYLHQFTGTCNHDMDADFYWYRCQEAVQNFNSSAHHCILLASNLIFRSCPSLLPYTTDVVLVLSDDWFVPTDVRRCMQLGRSNPDSKLEEGEEGSGSSEKSMSKFNMGSLTIVRVVTRGTLEEAIIRSGGNIKFLQGKKLGDIHSSKLGTIFRADIISSILSHAPGLTESYRTLKEREQSGLSQSPLPFEEIKRVGIGKGKGKGLMIQGPKGGAVSVSFKSSFSSLPFASSTKDEDVSAEHAEADIWLKGREVESSHLELTFDNFDYNKKGHAYRITDDEHIDCAVEKYNAGLGTEWKSCALVVHMTRTWQHFWLNASKEQNILRYPIVNDQSTRRMFKKNGVGVASSERAIMNLFQRNVNMHNSSLPVSALTHGRENANVVCGRGEIINSHLSVSARDSSVDAFRENMHNLKRSGDVLDQNLYLHPLQHASPLDIVDNALVSRNNPPRLNSHFIIKYMKKPGEKKVKARNDMKFKKIDQPLGLSIDSVPEQNRDNVTTSEHFVTTGRYPYGPAPLSMMRKPINFRREHTTDAWTKEEDEYIMELSETFGSQSWWLMER